MPLPNPGQKESKDEFLSRCMSDDTMNKEYPDRSQRYAICMRQSKANIMEAAEAAFEFDNYGYTEDLTEYNFYAPGSDEYEDYEDDEQEEIDITKAKPGLWENIRKKKEREGKDYKPAKPGDKDRPDPEAWKKAQSGDDSEMAREQLQKMHDQLMGIMSKLPMVEFEEWTKDMISKAEIYVQNVYDFVKYYRPGKYEEEESYAAEYQGRKVTLNKPFRTPDGPKKFAVYTKNPSGNVVIVRFGDPDRSIKKHIPERRKSFRARHNCDNPGPKHKARYWACRSWVIFLACVLLF